LSNNVVLQCTDTHYLWVDVVNGRLGQSVGAGRVTLEVDKHMGTFIAIYQTFKRNSPLQFVCFSFILCRVMQIQVPMNCNNQVLHPDGHKKKRRQSTVTQRCSASQQMFLPKIKYLAVNHKVIEKLSSMMSTQHFVGFEL
jgi:hypothetical protein